MEWLARNVSRRIDPAESLPDVRSVIVVGRNYYTDHDHPDNPDHAKISRYAWGRDYHRILPKKLKRAHRFIQSLHPGAVNRWYVDTGPIMEKAWAVRAGVGWMGKHTNVISRSHGSWLFLGVLLTSLELDYDDPIPDYCGSCTRCIDACPTDAIVEPYVVDSNRCISYVTIEEKPKEPLDPTFADKFDGWVFGCDICQDVCPWNKFERQTDESDFEPRPGTLDLTFDALERMSDEEFRERFQGSPVMRAKPDGMRRNARDVGAHRTD
jgi:epoxyqueuosine reductase